MKIKHIIAVLATVGIVTSNSLLANSTCFHLGGSVTCPAGITPGSTSIEFVSGNDVLLFDDGNIGRLGTSGACPAPEPVLIDMPVVDNSPPPASTNMTPVDDPLFIQPQPQPSQIQATDLDVANLRTRIGFNLNDHNVIGDDGYYDGDNSVTNFIDTVRFTSRNIFEDGRIEITTDENGNFFVVGNIFIDSIPQANKGLTVKDITPEPTVLIAEDIAALYYGDSEYSPETYWSGVAIEDSAIEEDLTGQHTGHYIQNRLYENLAKFDNYPATIVNKPGDGYATDSFGLERSNLFVASVFDNEFVNDVFNEDLDGYLLIGKGQSIDGAYLPRDYDAPEEGSLNSLEERAREFLTLNPDGLDYTDPTQVARVAAAIRDANNGQLPITKEELAAYKEYVEFFELADPDDPVEVYEAVMDMREHLILEQNKRKEDKKDMKIHRVTDEVQGIIPLV